MPVLKLMGPRILVSAHPRGVWGDLLCPERWLVSVEFGHKAWCCLQGALAGMTETVARKGLHLYL